MKRRTFLGSAMAFGAAQAQQQQRERRFDLVIRNGEVRDPGNNVKRKADVGIRDGKIAAIEDSIPVDRGYESIDAKGLYVTPGLIDLHTHCYYGGTGLGVLADPIAARSGVTTWVDAGSFGWDQFPGFRRFIVEPAHARIFGYVYTYTSNRNPSEDPISYARKGMRRTGETVRDNKDIMIGVKIQVGANMSGKYSYDLLKVARETCDQYQIPLMAHISFAPPETDQVMELMKPGDVVTHAYNGHTLGIIDKEGKIKPSVLEARKRGVWFDIGHGLGSFNFAATRKALDAGFVCDTISTDIYNLNVRGPVFDMPTTMTKLLHMGMSFDDILLRVTANPAKIINQQQVRVPKLGTIEVGAPADVALLALEEGQFTLVDSQRNTVTTSKRIASRVTICRGRRMYATEG